MLIGKGEPDLFFLAIEIEKVSCKESVIILVTFTIVLILVLSLFPIKSEEFAPEPSSPQSPISSLKFYLNNNNNNNN